LTPPERPPLLLYLARGDDLQRFAVAPALAGAAERSGWGFELYYDALRRGRHFGGGEVDAARPGTPGGSPPAGGGHAEQLAWLAAHFAIVAVGDPDALLWPVLERLGVEGLVRSRDPAAIYAGVYERLKRPMPTTVRVLDGAPQGPRGLILAPYLYPDLLSGEPALAMEVSGGGAVRGRLEQLGASSFCGLGVDRERARAFPEGLDEDEALVDAGGSAQQGWAGAEDYAAVTVRRARRHRAWGAGVLLGDPDLVAAQLPKVRRLRLLPLYGRLRSSPPPRTFSRRRGIRSSGDSTTTATSSTWPPGVGASRSSMPGPRSTPSTHARPPFPPRRPRHGSSSPTTPSSPGGPTRAGSS
jgi:hypothetical protein